MIRNYDDGTVRIGTVAGNYTIKTNNTENSDNIKYILSVDTGYDNLKDANLFAVAPYGTEEYNPIRVTIARPINKASTSHTTANTEFILIRDNQEYDLAAQFIYTQNEDKYQIEDTTFQIVSDEPQLMPTFSFQTGDIVKIPDYNSEIMSKAINNLPSYEITCKSENCLEFSIVPFTAKATPEIRFNIENIKNEAFTSIQQPIN